MIVQTIKSKDGKHVYHGTVTWRNKDEFGFIPQGERYAGEWWCKLDYWDLKEAGIPLFRITT